MSIDNMGVGLGGLIDRLRSTADWQDREAKADAHFPSGCLLREAADAYEALAAERDAYKARSVDQAMELTARDLANDMRESERDAARAEAYELRLTILGGEDAPGFAGSLTLQEIKDLHHRTVMEAQEREDATRAEVKRLREALEEIERGHIPSVPMTQTVDELTWAQMWVGHIPFVPMTQTVDELTWAQMWVGHLRKIARAALAQKEPRHG